MNLIDKEELKAYAKPNDGKAFIDILLRVLLHVSCIVLAYYFFSIRYYLLSIIVLIPHFISYSFLGWGGIGHELFHNSVFSNPFLNKFLFRLFSILTWNNYSYFEVTHWHHHRKTLAANDLEANPTAKVRVLDLVLYATFDITSFLRRIRILFMNAFGIVRGTVMEELFPVGKKRLKLFQGARVILVFHFLLITIFILIQAYWLILFINLAPFFLTIYNKILTTAQHYGVDSPPKDFNNYFLNTRTVILDSFSSFLYANMNFHVEHHFYPHIPYYNLPKVHKTMKVNNSYTYYSTGLLALIKELKAKKCFG